MSEGLLPDIDRNMLRASRLGAWLNEGWIQAEVVAALKRADYALTLREISEASGVYSRHANRVLYRLWKKGLVTRYKLAMQRHAFCRKQWKVIPNASRRMLFVYRWRELADEQD